MEIKSKYIYKYVLRCFLKEFKESAFLKDAVMLFHNLGPAIENIRSPKDLSLDLGTWSNLFEQERKE